MISKNIDLSELLHQAGLRVTPQRIAICEMVMNSDRHPTANDIYGRLKEVYSSISLATIYNTLDVLVDMGMVNALGSTGDDTVHFDGNTIPHLHLVCIRCHRIVDNYSNYVEMLESEIRQSSGYKLLGSRVVYYGICPECREQERLPSNQ